MGVYTKEICSLAGIFKLLESILVFVALMVHRYGDHGDYVFFGTTLRSMNQKDPTVDTENLGNGTLMTYAIISPILLIAYCLDGRYVIQSLFLEMFWNFIGAILFLALGIKTTMIWADGKKADEWAGMDEYFTNYSAGLALGGICITLSLVYFIDFFISSSARKRLKRDAY